MTLTAGTKLGPYEILSPLGAGGMGEVYRARDTRLAREVAIKVLPESLASDVERLRRFEKEARSASALNHPNIVTIYDIGSDSGVSYIAMELVDGATLREQLASGPLPIKRLLQVAPQVAEGLARAHEAGIVHRDLKPENVMVKKDGLVKILDFGLAKLSSTGSGSDEASQLPTMTGTQPGVVVGTVSYMSPEQASGQTVDFRSDQFSLGAMLYEMVTGHRAFQRKTAIDTLSAILNEEPSTIAATSPQTPTPLRWIVERCLTKEPQGRYASTQDLARDLSTIRDHLSESISSGALTPVVGGEAKRRRLTLRILGAMAAMALIVAGALSQRWLISRGARTEVPSVRQITFRRGNVVTARFAPDGRTVVYGAAWDGAPAEIFTVRTDSTESRSLGFPRANPLGISSKGELAILLRRSEIVGGAGTLARVPLGGGTPREILEDVWDADWAPNGEDLAVLRRLPNGNQELQYPIGTTLAEGNSIIDRIRVSPNGDLVAFFDDDTLATVDRRGKRNTVSRGWLYVVFFAWSPRGDELIVVGARSPDKRALYAVSLSGRERVLEGLAPDMALYDVASDGRLLVEYFHGLQGVACQRAGEDRERELALHSSSVSDISEDGQLILLSDSSVPDELLLRRTDGSPAIHLGKGEPQGLSADGRWVLAILKGPPRELALVPTGPGAAKKIEIEDVEPQQAVLLPNGKGFLVLAKGKGERTFHLFLVTPEGGKARPVAAEGFSLGQSWVASPDGERFAYLANDGRLRVGPVSSGEVTTVPGPPLLPATDFPAQWSADGRFLFIFSPGGVGIPARFDRLELATGRRELWKKLMPADPTGVDSIGGFCISRDGLSYAYAYTRVQTSDLFVVEGIK